MDSNDRPTAPGASRMAGIERVVLWLMLPVLVLTLVLHFRLSARLGSLERLLGTSLEQVGQPGSDGDAAVAGERQKNRAGREGRGARPVAVSFDERQEILRVRLDGFIADQQLDESAQAALKDLVEGQLATTAEIRTSRRAGDITLAQAKEQLDALQGEVELAATALLGAEPAAAFAELMFRQPSGAKEPEGEE